MDIHNVKVTLAYLSYKLILKQHSPFPSISIQSEESRINKIQQ